MTDTWSAGMERAAEFFVCSGGHDDDLTDILPVGCGARLDRVYDDVRSRVLGPATGAKTYREAAAVEPYAPSGEAATLPAAGRAPLPAYVSGGAASARRRCCLLLAAPGALGDERVAGPRLRRLADRIAASCECVCVAPDLPGGADAEAHRAALVAAALPYLRDERGCDVSRVAVFGLGSGGAVALLAARSDWCACCCCCDADFDAVEPDAAASAARAAAGPFMLLHARAPAPALIRNALVATPRGGECVFDAYEDMAPGFLLLGDVGVPAVDRDVELATTRLLAFAGPYLP